MKRFLYTWSLGFAIFSMFFGSGNLVFPILVGTESAGHSLLGSLGIILTGVLVPFLGVYAIYLFEGQLSRFFARFGNRASFYFSLLALSLMGPFGVLARCITIAHGSIHLLLPSLSLPLFSALFSLLLLGMLLSRGKLLNLLGSWLTPMLLVALSFICFYGLQHPAPLAAAESSPLTSLKIGVLQGYQTMDLLAAFFFSSFVLQRLRQREESPSEQGRLFFFASLIGASLLALVYLGLVTLGSLYKELLVGVPPQEMLGTIAKAALGPLAAPLVSVTIMLACLTTAVVLAELFSSFLRIEVTKERLSSTSSYLITLLLGCLVSTLDFAGIAKILGPILETLYPALIVLTLLNIAEQLWAWRNVRWPVAAMLASKLLSRMLF